LSDSDHRIRRYLATRSYLYAQRNYFWSSIQFGFSAQTTALDWTV